MDVVEIKRFADEIGFDLNQSAAQMLGIRLDESESKTEWRLDVQPTPRFDTAGTISTSRGDVNVSRGFIEAAKLTQDTLQQLGELALSLADSQGRATLQTFADGFPVTLDVAVISDHSAYFILHADEIR